MRNLTLVLFVSVAGAFAGCQSCIPERGALPYKCSRAEGAAACEGGWVCGLDGVCFDPKGDGGSFLCESQADCAEGWQCGTEGRCYDLATATDVECRGEDAGDCAPGWRCGLEGECHDTAVGAAYECESDRHCEQDWRCGLEGVCVDSRLEALRPAPAPSSLSSARLTWPDLASYPTKFSAADLHDDGGVFFATYLFVDDAGALFAGRRDDQMFARRLPVPASQVRDVVAFPGGGYVLAGNQVSLYAFNYEDGGLRQTVLPFTSPADDRLRRTRVDYPPAGASEDFLISFNRSSAAIFLSNTDAGTGRFAPPPDAGFLDVIVMAHYWSNGVMEIPRSVMAATDQGIFIAELTVFPGFAPTWVPMPFGDLPALPCDGVAPERPIDELRFGQDRGLVRYLGVRQGERIRMYQHGISSSSGTPGCLSSNLPLYIRADYEITTGRPPDGGILACPPGYAFHRWIDLTDQSANVRCRGSADGGAPEEITVNHSVRPINPPDFTEEGLPMGLTLADPSSANVRAQFLDRHARAFRCAARLCETDSPGHAGLVFQEGTRATLQTIDPAVDSNAASNDDRPYPLVSGVGFIGTMGGAFGSEAPVVRGRVQNASDLAILQRGAVSDPTTDVAAEVFAYHQIPDGPPLLALGGSEEFARHNGLPRGFARGEAVALADGGTALLLAMVDKIWATDVRLPESFGTAAVRPPIRLVPLPSGQISSMAFTASDAGSSEYLSGFVLAQERLFRVVAETPTRYRSTELNLPSGKTPLTVWMDGRAGRIGFTDGEVFSLPSLVTIAPPTGERVYDFAEACGTGYALTATRLLMLRPVEGASVGRWEPVGLPGFAPLDLSFGRLQVDGDSLLVMSGGAIAWRVTLPQSCP